MCCQLCVAVVSSAYLVSALRIYYVEFAELWAPNSRLCTLYSTGHKTQACVLYNTSNSRLCTLYSTGHKTLACALYGAVSTKFLPVFNAQLGCGRLDVSDGRVRNPGVTDGEGPQLLCAAGKIGGERERAFVLCVCVCVCACTYTCRFRNPSVTVEKAQLNKQKKDL
jgi:hypothetical protein